MSKVRGQRFTRREIKQHPGVNKKFFRQLNCEATLELFLFFYSEIDIALSV